MERSIPSKTGQSPSRLRKIAVFWDSYYRKFVKNFAIIAAPLHELTHKNVRFKWDDQCQEAFVALKMALITAPIFALPTDEGSYVIDTDASGLSIGAVLSQEQDEQENVIAYASKLLSPAERSYCVTWPGPPSVIYYLKYFRQYLLGRKFVIRTDHAALSWLRRTPEPEEYDFDMIHRPGMQHGNAAALSRRPWNQCGLKDEEDIWNICCTHFSLTFLQSEWLNLCQTFQFHIDSKRNNPDPDEGIYHPPHNKEANDAVFIQAIYKSQGDVVPIDELETLRKRTENQR